MLKYNVLMIMKRLDSSVKHWNDKKRAWDDRSGAIQKEVKRL
ncbi:hypothetical protein [Wolbachia endosymbiont (group A) of Andrena hattorfiana]|nr:hypothetical protein [Wolbachia endosymbiont (group A) of Andrena hattorfiana]